MPKSQKSQNTYENVIKIYTLFKIGLSYSLFIDKAVMVANKALM